MATPDATLAAMQGTWLIEEALEAGRAVTQGTATLRISGNTFARVTPSHVFERTLTLRPGQAGIMELDLHVTNDPGKGSTLLGIVEIDRDTMKICHALGAHPRPTEFRSTAENGSLLSISRRHEGGR